MNSQEKLPITRINAICKAITLLERQENRAEEICILKKLATGVPILQWTEWVVRDCIDDFYLEYKRLPTVTDLNKSNNLPQHPNFKYLFGISASQWLKKNYESYVPPKTSRKKTLLTAINLLDGEERQRLQEMLNEYPITKWNNTNLIDCFVTYFEKYNKIPSEDEMDKSDELPYYSLFSYRWKTTYLKWLNAHLPYLYEQFLKQRKYQRDYRNEFINEYNRIKPKTEADFNKRKNPEMCRTYIVKRALNIPTWAELIKHCGLVCYKMLDEREAKERSKIRSISLISVDCGENILFKEFIPKEKKYELIRTYEVGDSI